MPDEVDADDELGTITCCESNESDQTKTKRLKANEICDNSTRKKRTEHEEHDEKCRC